MKTRHDGGKETRRGVDTDEMTKEGGDDTKTPDQKKRWDKINKTFFFI